MYRLIHRTTGSLEANNCGLNRHIPTHTHFFRFALTLINEEAKKAYDVGNIVRTVGTDVPKKKLTSQVSHHLQLLLNRLNKTFFSGKPIYDDFFNLK